MIEINLEIAQRIVNLLSQFPYNEVADIIEIIKQQANKKD